MGEHLSPGVDQVITGRSSEHLRSKGPKKVCHQRYLHLKGSKRFVLSVQNILR